MQLETSLANLELAREEEDSQLLLVLESLVSVGCRSMVLVVVSQVLIPISLFLDLIGVMALCQKAVLI